MPNHALDHLPAFAWTLDRDGNLTSQVGRKDLRGSLGEWTTEAHRRALAGESSSRRLVWYGVTVEVRVEPVRHDERIDGSAGLALEVEADPLAAPAVRVAHDFNNLLLVIGGHATLLARSLDPGSSERERVEDILCAVRRATTLTSQLQSIVSPA